MNERRLLLTSWIILVTAQVGYGDRPNVIVIYADDQGSVDTRRYGARDLETPALDALCDRGVRFTQFYSPAAVCSPSRAGMLTGRYPWRCGVPGNSSPPPPQSVDDLSTVNDLPSRNELGSDQVTMAELFRTGGYATAHIGKWHLGYRQGSKPLDQGFDYSFGHMGGCIDNFAHFFYWNGPNRHDLWEDNRRVRYPNRFFPDLMVEKASEYIRRVRDEPFFMYFALNMPHYPYQGDDKWLAHYNDLPYPRNLYAAFLSTLDDRLGRLLRVLDEEGIREKTIVVYQSDNGHSLEERAHFGGGSAGPYRGAKFSLFEGGIRLPAIISWPGRLPEGAVRSQMAHGCDWFPTLAELCGLSIDHPIDGRSLLPVIRDADAPSPHQTLAWKAGDRAAYRSGSWKLLHKPSAVRGQAALPPADQEWFLVNVDQDPGETKNQREKHPEIFARMQSELEAAMSKTRP